MRSANSRGQRGFTLAELLAGLAILALLAGLILPALSKAKNHAQFTRCKSNVRQLSIALMVYVADNDVYPLYADADIGPMARPNESFILPNYFATQREKNSVFHCPTDEVPACFIGLPAISYGFNCRGMSDQGKGQVKTGELGLCGIQVSQSPTGGSYRPMKDAAVVAPADMIALGDAFAESKGKVYRSLLQGLGFNFGFVTSIVGTDPEKLAVKRHNSRANIAFCDGHVEAMGFNDLFGETDAAYQRWNADHLPHADMRLR